MGGGLTSQLKILYGARTVKEVLKENSKPVGLTLSLTTIYYKVIVKAGLYWHNKQTDQWNRDLGHL